MPTANSSKDMLGAISRDLVANDPVLQRIMKDMITDAILQASYTLKYGTNTDKTALMRMLAPHMLEALRETQATERAASEKAAYARITAALRGETPT